MATYWAKYHQNNPEATVEDRNKYKKSHSVLHRVIKPAKGQYRNKVESYYTGSTPVACGRGYSPRITKEDPPCPTILLYQTNSMHVMHSSTITMSCRV
jgi:hypothetical protein